MPEPRQTAQALHARGAWLVPLGENGFPMVKGFTAQRLPLVDAPCYGILPFSVGYLVLDVDEGDPDSLTAGWPADAYFSLPSKTPGRAHVYVAWDEAWGEVGNKRWTKAGCVGDIRHRKGIVRVYHEDALLEALFVPRTPAKRIRQNIASLSKPIAAKGGNGARDGGTTSDWNASGRNNTLYMAVLDEPDRVDEWREKAAASGLDESEIEATVRSALGRASEREDASSNLLRNPAWGLDPQNPSSWARQCPLPIRWNELYGRWYTWGEGVGWQTPEDGDAAIENYISDWAWRVAEAEIAEGGKAAVLRGFDLRITQVRDALKRRDNIRLTPSAMDADPDMVAQPDGTLLHLPTGEVAAYDETMPFYRPIGVVAAPGPAPEWQKFLAFCIPDAESREWLRAWIAYALSGHVGAETALVLRGSSGTGKSTITRVIERLAGDLASVQRGENIIGSSDASNWIVDMMESRCAIVNEVPSGKWASSLKGIISGDPQAARRLYQNYARYQPRCTVTISTNSLPRLEHDDGMDRRLALIEMWRKPERRDPRLHVRLDRELPQILHWAAMGWTEERHYVDVVLGRAPLMQQAIDVYIAEAHPLRRHLQQLLVESTRQDFATYRGIRDAFSLNDNLDDKTRERYRVLTDGTLNAALKALGYDPELDAAGEWLVRGVKFAVQPEPRW